MHALRILYLHRWCFKEGSGSFTAHLYRTLNEHYFIVNLAELKKLTTLQILSANKWFDTKFVFEISF